jgi:hypothetical protein
MATILRNTSVFAALLLAVACDESASTSDGPDCNGGKGGSTTTAQGGGGAQGTGAQGTGAAGAGTQGTGAGGSTSAGTEPGPEDQNTGNDDNTFDHMNDPGSSGKKDPFELLKERAEEGPPEVRSRLHGCTKIRYEALGTFLTSRGVNLAATGTPKTAGQLYNEGRDALGVAKFEAREAEAYFHTTSGATKLFDIFIQASAEVIANIENVDACKIEGVGFPMFDAEGACVVQSLSCVMGRPAKDEDMILCTQLAQDHDGTPADISRKQQLAVAAFLSAAHTCE